jgi:L-alanine-DL-glutamate epimerase-like enolase superfamily enzyme
MRVSGRSAVRVEAATYDLNLEVPFAIARGTTSAHQICVARIEHEGVVGLGEASPSAYYGDSLALAREVIEGAGDVIGTDPAAIRRTAAELRQRFPSSPSGRAAVQCALYDIAGKLAGSPLYRLLGLAGLTPPRTSFTVGVENVAVARRRLDVLRSYPILKLKVGFGAEEELIQLLKQETTAVLRVDANEGWQVDEAIRKINAWQRHSVEFFEQPLPKHDRRGYEMLRKATDAVIFIDEGVSRAEDIPQWAGLADGINIKLMKCGGPSEALDMIAVARACGLKVMLGCMVESALGITAAAHLSGLADYCDLDGNLLITNDPFDGVRATGGVIRLPDLPGLGVRPVDPRCRA